MQTVRIANQTINIHRYNTIIVGAGAAGMNCAVHMHEFMSQKGIAEAANRIAVVTGDLAGGTSRMSGSDKQTYYKMAVESQPADSARAFADALTANGCCHQDLAFVEAVGSLREFYHLVQAGVAFPHDALGNYVGYKTDHDPLGRATSAGPLTSRFMSQCFQVQVERCGIRIYDQMEIAKLLTVEQDEQKQIVAVVTLNKQAHRGNHPAVNVFYCTNLVLAAGGPGELYKTSVYPQSQWGIHGIAFRAGLAAENLTESQFGLASTKFRWNVSGSYMQAVPRIFSTNATGGDVREFLAEVFPTMSRMATAIFLKGYQWPFDVQRVQDFQSSLIDLLVCTERQKKRRVFLDFRCNPLGCTSMRKFSIDQLEPQAAEYLSRAGAVRQSPIERLACMNPPAIDIYKQNGIDLNSEPLEIAVCAQHNNGGFAVDKWWQTNIPGTFVIGEMAGTHGVKRPGGAALNAGQVGGLRAAEYIVNVRNLDVPDYANQQRKLHRQLSEFIAKFQHYRTGCSRPRALTPACLAKRIRNRMTQSAGPIRQLNDAQRALAEALRDYRNLQKYGLRLDKTENIVSAVRAENLALTSVAYLKAIVEYLQQDGGSRGSCLVLDEAGKRLCPDMPDAETGISLRFKPENTELRDSILRVQIDYTNRELFRCTRVEPRRVPQHGETFESVWRRYREAKIYDG